MKNIYEFTSGNRTRRYSNAYRRVILDNIFKQVDRRRYGFKQQSFLKGLQSFFFTAPLE